MVDERVILALTQLGLTRYEAEVYATLVSLGEATVREIADRSSVPREKIYQVLRKLSEMGLARLVGKNPIKYVPTQPKSGLSEKLMAMKSTLNAVEDALNFLESMYSKARSKVKRVDLNFWEIPQRVGDVLLELIEKASVSLHALVTAEESLRLESWIYSLKKLSRRNVEIRIYAPLKESNVVALGRLSNVAEVRIIDDILDYSVFIVDGEAGFLIDNDLSFGIYFIDKRFCEILLRLADGLEKIPGPFQRILRLMSGEEDVRRLTELFSGLGLVRRILRAYEIKALEGDEYSSRSFASILLDIISGEDDDIHTVLEKISGYAVAIDGVEMDLGFDESLRALRIEVPEGGLPTDPEAMLDGGTWRAPSIWVQVAKEAVLRRGYEEGPTLIHYDAQRGMWTISYVFNGREERTSSYPGYVLEGWSSRFP